MPDMWPTLGLQGTASRSQRALWTICEASGTLSHDFVDAYYGVASYPQLRRDDPVFAIVAGNAVD